MSYRTWSVDGFGFNLSDVIENLNVDKQLCLRKLMCEYMNDEKPFPCEDFPEYYDCFDEPINPDDVLGAIKKAYEDYESENGELGPDAFVADIFAGLWRNADHDDKIISVVRDDFRDGSLYWLLDCVYPWYKPEFDSEEDCRNNIVKAFSGLVTPKDITFLSIEQGG